MLEGQDEHEFIEHGGYSDIFRNWLDTIAPQQPDILFFYDIFEEAEKKGGIGKSWLLNECAREASSRQDVAVIRVDFFSILDRDGLEIAQRVVDAVKESFPDWIPDAFEKAREDLRRGRLEGGLRMLRGALADDLARLPERLKDGRKHILIFCDTYERVEQHPEQLSLSSEYLFPDTYGCPLIGFVIAGRNAPDPTSANWYGRELDALPVEPFTLAEMLRYMDEHILYMDKQLQPDGADGAALFNATDATILHTRTQGRPILVGLLTDMLNNGALTLGQLVGNVPQSFEKFLVGRFNELTLPTDWIVLCMAHLYHRFNPAILRMITESVLGADAGIDEVWERLKALSFVRRSVTGNDIALHDEMRRMVLEWCWGKSGSPIGLERQQLSGIMINYYQQAIADERHAPLRQAYQVEMLYHQLYLDSARGFTQESEGFATFLERVKEAIDMRQYVYARSLLQEVKAFNDALLPEQRHDMHEQEARLLLNEEKYADALKLYEELLLVKEAAWLEENRAYLLHEKGICLTRLRRLSEAIATLTRSLEMYEQQHDRESIAITDSRIGYAYYQQGNLDSAIKFYRESLTLNREERNQIAYADALNSLVMVYIRRGKLRRALRAGQIALRQRRALNREQKLSEVGVASSLSTLGDVYYQLGEAEQARHYFRWAYEIYDRYANQKGRASISIYYGQLALNDGALQEAEDCFKKAAGFALHFDAESEVRSLNGQSWVHFKQNKTYEAIPLMQQAIKRAAEISDFYLQAESLVDLAEMLLQAGRFQEARSALEKAEGLATQYNHFRLLGTMMKIQGDVCRNEGRDQEAFRFYTRYCYYMALYNQAEYHKAERQIIEYLIDLPDEKARQIWRQLKDDWAALELPEAKYRRMRRVLKEVGLHLDL